MKKQPSLQPSSGTMDSRTSMANASSHVDDGSAQTSSLFLKYLSPEVDESTLIKTFGQFGPIDKVKVIRPRTKQEWRFWKTFNGFVTFKNRADSKAAMHKMQGTNIHGYPVKIEWARTQPRMAIRQEVLTPDIPDILVVPPEDDRVRYIIDMTALYVRDGGCAFEQAVMKRSCGNPLFRFLFDLKSEERKYYVWRLYSLTQGDTLQRWRTEPFVMFTGSGRWVPPALPSTEHGYYCLDCKSDLKLVLQQRCYCSGYGHVIITEEDYKIIKKLHQSKYQVLTFKEGFLPGECIMNCDASWNSKTKKVGCGISVRDYLLDFVEAQAIISRSSKEKVINFHSYKSIDAEIDALLHAIEIAMSYITADLNDERSVVRSKYKWVRYRIFSDCKPVVDAFNKGVVDYKEDGESKKVDLERINQCRVAAGLEKWDGKKRKYPCKNGENLLISVEWIDREKNFLADLLSKVESDIMECSYDELTECLQKAVYEDYILQISRIRINDAKTLIDFEREKLEKRMDGLSTSSIIVERPLEHPEGVPLPRKHIQDDEVPVPDKKKKMKEQKKKDVKVMKGRALNFVYNSYK